MNEQRAKLFGHVTSTQDDTFMRSAAQLEEANDETVRQLSEKVDDLKSLSYGIKRETEASNSMLSTMASTFGDALFKIAGTLRNVDTILGRSVCCGPIWLTVMFAASFMLLLYFVAS
ncbi:MAG: hypothetical protein KVP17_005343 [Porospora cf. gigantea B]|uniref:uncharacterized protein n=1 Tax=Porospora cf. gigantea B TaxID=2853592 RepID=UPI003571F028|nr:MAG: hypothetical protein KVP17_005343 [Porospora cf. gigantea B]